MIKKCFLLFISLVVLTSSLTINTAAFTPSTFEITAGAAVLASLDTGEVLYSKNDDQRMYPASLTKIMTAVIILEHTKDLDSEIITVSEHAIKLLEGTDSSTTGLKIGEKLTARQLLYNLLMASANDGANAAAEHYGSGSIDTFVDMMNDKAAELGMVNTHFANPHGLFDPNHYTTAYDLYLLTKYALTFKAFVDITSTTRYTMPATNLSPQKTLVTTNYLQDASTAYYYKYCAGVKTGYTDEAGRCLITTATKKGTHYVCVLMKCPVTDANGQKVRKEFGDAKQLYEWAFNEFEYKRILDTKVPVKEIPVALSMETDYVSLVLSHELSATLPKDADTSTVQVNVKLNKKSVDAPVKKGDEMGTAEISYAGEVIGNIPVVAADNVKQSKLLVAWRFAKNVFSSTWFKIIMVILAVAVIVFIIYCIVLNRRAKRYKRVKKYRRF